MESPCGWLQITAAFDAIVAITFIDLPVGIQEGNAVTRECIAQLAAYFERKLFQFDLPLRPAGTAFQQQVWSELCKIPFGETRSYEQIARKIGGAEKTRAVGLANGKNPVAVVIPCHRVIGANGSLTGYAGGLMRKRWLLDHESDQQQMLL